MPKCVDCQKEIILSKEDEKLEAKLGILPIRCDICISKRLKEDLKNLIIQIKYK